MSFGDLVSSGRGPGVIGMFVALVVLVGFAAVSMFAFDSELQGEGVSTESVIRHQAEEIEGLTYQIDGNLAMAENAAKVTEKNKDIEGLIKQNAADLAKLNELRATALDAKDSFTSTTEALNGYVTEYRNFIRKKAIGESIPELKLKSGDSYTEVEIRDVTEIGVEIRHSGGQSRIAFEKLATEWQERFQFDPEEKAKALEREKAAQALYETASNDSQEISEEAAEDPSTIERSDRINKAIRAKALEMARLKTHLGRLQAEAVKVETGDSINRPKGRSDVRLSLELRKRIQETESQIIAMARQISSLRTKLAQ